MFSCVSTITKMRMHIRIYKYQDYQRDEIVMFHLEVPFLPLENVINSPWIDIGGVSKAYGDQMGPRL